MSIYPSRFATTNLAYGATLQNGTGGGAPALVQDAAFPMANLLADDRQILWSPGAAAFPLTITVDVTLASAATVSALSLMGLRLATGSAITSIEFFTQAGAYTPGGTWTSRGSVAAPYPAHGLGVQFVAVASVASVRAVLTTVTGLFTSGRLFIGDPFSIADSFVADQGGRGDSPSRNVTLYRLPSGSVFQVSQGSNARKISLTMSNLSASQRSLLHGLTDATRPFLHLDAEGLFWDCLLESPEMPTTQTAPNPLFQVQADMIGLP